MGPALSVLIPARNEQFLSRTVADILEHSEADTEVIVVLDGPSPHEPPPDDKRVRVVRLAQSIGQRAATNMAAVLSNAKYLMKCDAHCSFAQGFDRVLLEDIEPGMTLVPTMRNLHVFDYVCPNGHRRYQSGPGPCATCGEPTTMELIWHAKENPQSRSYCFDSEPHFQYFREYNRRPQNKRGPLTETMSLQGSCFMLSRDDYWRLGICDESFGSWGSQGIEVAVKTWLSGGRCLVDWRTWYAHCFRTQPGFGFPYPLSGTQVEHAKGQVRDLFFENKWPLQVHPLSWLVERFWPVPGWTVEDLERIGGHVPGAALAEPSRGVVYYTDNRLGETIMAACQRQLKTACDGAEIVSASLKPVELGWNVVVDGERGPLTMFKQILAGLELSTADVVFLAEHDVLYHPAHFEFTPPRRDVVYYDSNFWQVDAETGRALTRVWRATSGLCAYRETLIEHYRKRVKLVEERGYSNAMGYEPGTHHRPERVDDLTHEMWRAEWPSIDIRHGNNLTPTRWEKSEFRNQRYTEGWQEADEVPGWGVTRGRFGEMLQKIAEGQHGS